MQRLTCQDTENQMFLMLCLRCQRDLCCKSSSGGVESWRMVRRCRWSDGIGCRNLMGFPTCVQLLAHRKWNVFPRFRDRTLNDRSRRRKKKCGRKSPVEISQWQGSESLSGETLLTDRIPSAAIVIQESVPSRLLVPASFVPHLNREFCGCLTDFPAACERQSRLAINPHRLWTSCLFSCLWGNANCSFCVFCPRVCWLIIVPTIIKPFKWIVHPKIMINLHSIPNLYDSLYFVKHKRIHLTELSHYLISSSESRTNTRQLRNNPYNLCALFQVF